MKSLRFAVALCLASLVAAPAAAAPTPSMPAAMAVDANKILAELDRRAAQFDDQAYTATMDIHKGGKLKKSLVFDAVMQGLDRQVLEFTAPGDVAGMKVLMKGAGELYVYMPEFKKVRRVAAHAMNQGFNGSEWTLQDMSEVKLAPFYKAELGESKGTTTTLILTPKEGVTTPYSKLEVVIDSKVGAATHVNYYDGAGNHVREQQREEWKKIEGQLVPTKISMLNHKTGDRSVITMTNIKVNQGVDESIFSRRTLLRG